MSVQKILAIVAVVVVIGGIALWAQTGKQDAVQETINTPMEEVETSSEPMKGFGSFESLVSLGKSVQCNFSFNDEEGTVTSGTSYISGDRMRVDSTTNVDGEVFETHMINDGTYIYTWTVGDSESTAVRMSVSDEMDMNEVEDDVYQDQYTMDNEQEVEYECNNWRVDAGTFVPPADIEFVDMQEMLNDMMNQMPEGFEMPEGFPMMQ